MTKYLLPNVVEMIVSTYSLAYFVGSFNRLGQVLGVKYLIFVENSTSIPTIYKHFLPKQVIK